jgi:hypothetical protein
VILRLLGIFMDAIWMMARLMLRLVLLFFALIALVILVASPRD